MEQKCMLAAFAHPDDESFGTAGAFRRYKDEGVHTALICATKGEEGEISDPALATKETLGAVREGELRTAAGIMGVDDLVFLGYHDGQLADANPDEATGKIVREIRRLKPQVVVTFAANGGYGHVDHMAIYRLTREAFHKASDPNSYPEQLAEGLKPYKPQKLYAVGFPRTAMSRMRELAQAAGQTFTPGGDAATIPLEEMGTPEDQITTKMALSDMQFQTKMLAMNAHRTQIGDTAPTRMLPADVVRSWLGTERFTLLEPAGQPADSEDDLFAGVTL